MQAGAVLGHHQKPSSSAPNFANQWPPTSASQGIFFQLRNGAPRLRLKVPADGRKVQRNGSLLATGILQPRACLEQEPQGLQVATQGSMVQGRPIQGIPDLWVAEIYR